MPLERSQDTRLEADGVMVRPISGQIYLVEETKDGGTEAPWEEPAPADSSSPPGLINRH